MFVKLQLLMWQNDPKVWWLISSPTDQSLDRTSWGWDTSDHWGRESGFTGEGDCICAGGWSPLQLRSFTVHQCREVSMHGEDKLGYVKAVCADLLCLCVCRIVCDMAEALLPHSPGGPVELCIGVCSAEFRTLSSQTYSFVVSENHSELILVCNFNDSQLVWNVFTFSCPFLLSSVESQLQSCSPRERTCFWWYKTDNHRSTPGCWQHRQCLYQQGGVSVCQVSLNLLTHKFVLWTYLLYIYSMKQLSPFFFSDGPIVK